jgi:hypothetical protein
MRSSDDLFRRRQILRDQLSELKLLRRRVFLAEKRIKSLEEETMIVNAISGNFETIGRQSWTNQ